MEADTRIEETFAGWLYRPYFDLGTWRTGGNPHTRGLELAREAVVAQDDRYARLHTTILPSARHAIIRHTGLVQYLVDDPVDLDPRLRTPSWEVLCEQLGVYDKLDPETRVRLLWLLHRLCMHAAIVKYETSPVPRTSRLTDGDAAVLFMRGQAGLSLFRDGKGRFPSHCWSSSTTRAVPAAGGMSRRPTCSRSSMRSTAAVTRTRCGSTCAGTGSRSTRPGRAPMSSTS